jgi:hypothetical protein
MATTKRPAKKRAAKPKPVAAKRPAKRAAAVEDSENGATGGLTPVRRKDKLEGLTEVRRRNIAKLIFKERSKSPSTSWGDIGQLIEDKFDWELPGSMTGRRLLREYGPDEAEAAIIKQNRSATPAKKKAAKKAKVVEEEYDEEEVEDEELEEEEELEYEEEDEDEEEYEDEEEEPEPEPVKAKKVRVKRGAGKKANPS